MGSARTVTGVGPRNVFVFTGTAAGGVAGTVLTTDNILGGVTAAWRGTGVYSIDHNIGNTAYCCQFTAERDTGDDVLCYVVDRGVNGVTCQCEGAGGGGVNATFVHATIHDGGG
tara:strand:- start:447 stop:788 length:342 start_codon:yes stop_codon:yes gene_type:complete